MRDGDYDEDWDDEDDFDLAPTTTHKTKLTRSMPESQADPRFNTLAKLLAAGHDPEDAVDIAKFPKMEPAAVADLCSLPIVKELTTAIVESATPVYALTKEQTLAHLRAIVETPIEDITPDSPLCQSVQYHWKTGAVTRISAIDKLKALDMSNKMQGFYAPEKHEIDPGDKMLDILSQTREDAEQDRDKLSN